MIPQAVGWLRQNLVDPIACRLSSVQKSNAFNATFSVAQALKDPQNILIVSDSRPGALFLAASQFWSIRNRYPNARICLLARSDRAFIAREIPFVDHVIIYEEFLFPLGRRLRDAIKQLEPDTFDLAFCFSTNTSFCPAYLCYKSGARIRIGFQRKNVPFFNIRIVPRQGEDYEEQRLSLLLRTLGIPQVKERVSWSVSKESAQKIQDRFLVGRKPDEQFVALDVSTSTGERPPAKQFREIAQYITDTSPGRLLVFFDFAERKIAHQIKDLLGPKALLFQVDDLPKIVALLATCQQLVACNSDLFHLGVAMGLSVNGIFDAQDIPQWAPPNRDDVQIFDTEAVKMWSPQQIAEAFHTPLPTQIPS